MSQELTTVTGSNVTPISAEAERQRRSVFRPLADVAERDEAILVELEVPGARQEGLEVTLENRVLTVKARVDTPSRDGWSLLHREYGEGDYERSFILSEDIDVDHIEATVTNGLLRLALPKSEKARSRRIEIKAA